MWWNNIITVLLFIVPNSYLYHVENSVVCNFLLFVKHPCFVMKRILFYQILSVEGYTNVDVLYNCSDHHLSNFFVIICYNLLD